MILILGQCCLEAEIEAKWRLQRVLTTKSNDLSTL